MAKADSGGLRNWLNQNPLVAIGAIVVLVGGALYLAFLRPAEGPPPQGDTYFTTDLGATSFTASKDNLPPFQRGGEEAVQLVMFSCDGGLTQIKGYLFKYTDAGKADYLARQEAAKIPGGRSNPNPPEALVRKIGPDGGEWVKQSNVVSVMSAMAQGGGTDTSAEITTPPTCPDGTPAKMMHTAAKG